MSYPSFITAEHVEKISADEAKFILEHSEKLLKEILDTEDALKSRTITVVTLTSGLMIGLVGFLVKKLSVETPYDSFFFTTLLAVAYLIYPGYSLITLLLPTELPVLGAQPITFFREEFFDEQVHNNDRLKIMYLNEIHNCQDRITSNKSKTGIRWQKFRRSFMMIAGSPLVFVVLYLMVNAIRSCFFSQ